MTETNIALEAHRALAAVCPIVSLSLKDRFDKSTWRVEFDPAATVEQRAAALAALDAFDPASLPVPAIVEGAAFLARVTDAEYAAALAAATSNPQVARWLDILRMRGEIDVNGRAALAAKAGLVALGILSTERADAIFSV